MAAVKQTLKAIWIRISVNLFARISAAATAEGRSMTNYVARLLDQYVPGGKS